jgi:predicted nucleic acid-binding protein
VRYWDSSALLPLIVQEVASGQMQGLLKGDRDVLTWWGSKLEAASALARLVREGALEGAKQDAAFSRMEALAAGWDEVLPTDPLREQAIRLLRVHALRSADALQLASAVVASEQNPGTLPFVTLDQRLREAAVREGFQVLPSA